MEHKFPRRINHLCMAMRLCGISIDEQGVELIDSVYDLIEKKGGDADLHDIAQLKVRWQQTIALRSIAKVADSPKPKPKIKNK